jgi:PleD family two-component response regulator
MSSTTDNSIMTDWSPKLLVIDDDPNAHDLTDYYLLGVVKEINHAMSGSEGISMAKTILPDVILLDIDMPDMDGYQVCRHLKEDEITRDIPILFVTKDRESCHIAKALDYGGSDYVTKPFIPVELQARVRSALRVKLANDVLRKQALIDPLTNLSNRRAFDDGLHASPKARTL